ncbi:hypothetical protein EON63_13660 [archaeon]|nr:MAG: hypothetical protein EON63_13660 [archaeon]
MCAPYPLDQQRGWGWRASRSREGDAYHRGRGGFCCRVHHGLLGAERKVSRIIYIYGAGCMVYGEWCIIFSVWCMYGVVWGKAYR